MSIFYTYPFRNSNKSVKETITEYCKNKKFSLKNILESRPDALLKYEKISVELKDLFDRIFVYDPE